MIIIDNRKMVVPSAEKTLGFMGDNAVASREFSLSEMALSSFVFKLDIQKANGETGIVHLKKTVDNNAIVLTWPIMESELDTPGELVVQIRAYSESGDEVWHSGQGAFAVCGSIAALAAFPSPLPSEFRQMEQRVTKAVELVEQVAEHIGDIATGADGRDGVSVTGATIDTSGHLILTLSSGSSIDCGVAVGRPGADGQQGERGLPGEQGLPGADAVVDYDAINETIASLLAAKMQCVDALPAEPVADVIYFIQE